MSDHQVEVEQSVEDEHIYEEIPGIPGQAEIPGIPEIPVQRRISATNGADSEQVNKKTLQIRQLHSAVLHIMVAISRPWMPEDEGSALEISRRLESKRKKICLILGLLAIIVFIVTVLTITLVLFEKKGYSPVTMSVADTNATKIMSTSSPEWDFRTSDAYYRTDCFDLYIPGIGQQGVHEILPENSSAFQAYCDQGWTLLLRRVDGSQNFNLSWSEYKHGFGDLQRNFWLGNEKMHKLTNQRTYTLRVDYIKWSEDQMYSSSYSSFLVEDEEEGYRLHVDSFSGNGTDGIKFVSYTNRPFRHGGMKFTTYDRDNDKNKRANCASTYGGGFWFNNCQFSLPTGPYKADSSWCVRWLERCTKWMIWKIKPAA